MYPSVMAGHSRSKNGVLSNAYVPAIHVFETACKQTPNSRFYQLICIDLSLRRGWPE